MAGITLMPSYVDLKSSKGIRARKWHSPVAMYSGAA